jgi:hypothetical protein
MKRIILTISAVIISATILSLSSFAQDAGRNNSDDYQTLIGRDKNMAHGFYGGFEFGYTQVANRNAMLTGFTAAWVVDHTLELGIVGKGFVTNPLPDMLLDNQNYLYTGGYGGFHVAATILGHKPINVSFPVTIGAGGISYLRSQYTGYYDEFYPESYYAFFVIEPGVELQLNMTRFFRLSAGVSYRYTSDIYLIYSDVDAQPVASPSILRGLNMGIKLKFGKF